MQRALWEVGLLAVAGGLLGTWVVLRRVAFFTHALGSATFPGLVLAGRWGVPAQLMGLLVAGCFAGGHTALTRARKVSQSEATGVLLLAALSLGVVLASDIYNSPASVDRLLFGTLLGIDNTDLAVSGIVALLAVLATLVSSRSWKVTTFDRTTGEALGITTTAAELLLSVLIGIVVVATLGAVGALLTSALLVVPAATARLLVNRLPLIYGTAVTIALLEGMSGLWIAYRLDIPPGPAVASLGSVVFVVAMLASSTTKRNRYNRDPIEEHA